MKMKKSEREFFIFTRSSLTPPIFLKFHYVPYTFLFALRIFNMKEISTRSSILYRFESETTRPSMRVALV